MDSENPYRASQNSNSVEKEKTFSGFAVRRISMQIFCVISIAAFLVTCICMVFDHTKFLKSDDPFIIGGLIACTTGVFLLLYHLSQLLTFFRIKPILGYLGGIALIALFLIGYDCMVHLPEGQGIPTMMGITLALSSVSVIPLTWIRINKPLILGACISAIIFGTGYLVTLYR